MILVGPKSNIGALRLGRYPCARLASAPDPLPSTSGSNPALASTVGHLPRFNTYAMTLQHPVTATKTAASRIQFP